MIPPGDLTVERRGCAWILSLRGEHDLSTVAALRSELAEVPEDIVSVVLDLSGATFIDSTILGAIVARHQQAAETVGQALVIVAPPGGIAHRLLELAALDRFIPVYDDLPTVLAALSIAG